MSRLLGALDLQRKNTYVNTFIPLNRNAFILITIVNYKAPDNKFMLLLFHFGEKAQTVVTSIEGVTNMCAKYI